MKKYLSYLHRFRRIPLGSAGKHALLLLSLCFLQFTLPGKEPIAFSLFYAALFCGFHPLAACGEYLLSALLTLSPPAIGSAALQAAFLFVVFQLCRRRERRMGTERILCLALGQIPFFLLFPFSSYSVLPAEPLLQKAFFSVLFLLLSLLFEGGLYALLHRAFRCRLTEAQLAEIALLWICVGMGITRALGAPTFYAVSLTFLLLFVLLLRNTAAVPLAVVLSVPLCVLEKSALPLAHFAVLSCAALLFLGYGRAASAIALSIVFLSAQYASGLFSEPVSAVIPTLLSCTVPAVLVCLIPRRKFNKLQESLLYYRVHALPRIAINRSRRAVGERLYEVSSLFREIETAFRENTPAPDATAQLTSRLEETFCADCPGRRRCENAGIRTHMERLVAIGCAKGQVNLVDLSAELSACCGNSAGLLFACNKLLASYRGIMREMETTRESRRLLAEQAHGVSEILKDIALEQSEEYRFSDGEATLSRALAGAGILSSEIFIYGEERSLTVTMTLVGDVDPKKLCVVAGDALGIPLTLAEKIPLTATGVCYILRRKPEYDAAFGVAFRKKDGETASGDTYSVLKIDERHFLVALSDGMGSGENARDVSDRTLTLLESFYRAKMPSETILGTVNRLISYSADDMFSCLDLAAVDLDTGEADIVKIGSPVGFILAKEELRVLEGQSLPLGALDAVHPATLRSALKENDFMLFLSDGVTSAFGSSDELYSYLSALRPMNPQSLAEEILSRALSDQSGKAEDDMTVLAVKLMKSA